MEANASSRGFRVPAGEDREGGSGLLIWGLFPLSIKVSTRDTGGATLLFEHRSMPRGGPPRHVHHGQDEWFYVVEGEYVIEIGADRHRLGPGDSLLAPRQIPHAWASVGPTPGTVLIALTPAGTFEDFIRETTRHKAVPPPEAVAAAFAAHDMAIVGPPLSLE